MTRIAQTLLAAAAGLVLAAGAQAQTVGIATLPPGSILNTQGTVIGKVVQDATKLKTRILPFGGDSAMIDAVNGGQSEFLVIDIGEITAALLGKEAYEGKPRPNLRAALMYNRFPMGIFVRKDSPMQKIEDLKGKRYPTGWAAHASVRLHSLAMLATGNLSEKDIVPFPTVNVIRGADDFKSGKVDAALFAVGGPKVAEVAAGVGGVRFLQMNDDPAAIARIKAVRPDYYIMEVPPLPHYVGVEKPTKVLGNDVLVGVGTHVSDEVVYEFVKAVHGNKAALAAGHPSFNTFDPAQTSKQFSALQYHPGAIKFYKEIGIWPAGK